MWKELRKLALAFGAIVCAALAICNDDKPKPPDEGVRPIVLYAPYTHGQSQAFDESLDVVGNYVKRSGDTMFGTLIIQKTGGDAIRLTGGGADINFNNTASSIVGLASGRGIASNAGGTFNASGTSWVANNALIAAGNGISAFATTGTGWYESAGTSSATIAGFNPGVGVGALIYDDTNNCWRSWQNGAWQSGCLASTTSGSAPIATTSGTVPAVFNPDGGEIVFSGGNYGLTQFLSGTNAVAANTVARDIAAGLTTSKIRGKSIRTIVQLAGAGAGNVTITLTEVLVGTVCTGTMACAAGLGGGATIACDFNAGPGTELVLTWDGTACTTVPLGTAVFTFHPVL